MLKLIFLLISLLPINFLKIFVYNLFKNINISYDSKIGIGIIFISKEINIINSKIGHLNYFNCKKLSVYNSKIKNKNSFININHLKLSNNAIIGSYNKIFSRKKKIYIKMFRSQISSNFRFQLSNSLYLGKNVVLGGINSKIIDQGQGNKRTIFLENIFVGSNVVFLNGLKINKNIVIGANSLINKDILLSGKYFSKKLIDI